MEVIRIGGSKDKDRIEGMLRQSLDGWKIKIEKINYKKRFDFLLYPAKSKSFNEVAFYDILANLIENIIIHIYIKNIIKNKVLKICNQYTIVERNEITEYAYNILKNTKSYTGEKEIINRDITNYLIENKSILIDGYIKFQLRKYSYIIDMIIEDAIVGMESQREYEEFLTILQYFVDIQEPKLELVHVILKDNDYLLVDKDNKILESGLLEDMGNELYYEEVSKADLLVSSLIILSPLNLIIHMEKDTEKELIKVILEVFGDRVSFCKGCERCKINMKLRDGNKRS